MINLKGYKTDNEIYRSANSVVFRGYRISDEVPVVLKLLNKEFPSDEEMSYFMREYEVTRKLLAPGIIKVYSLEKYNNSLVIVMEDFGAESIRNVMASGNFTIAEKLALVIKMVDTIIQTHQYNIIHKDINPSNIIWNRKKDLVKVIDFGISVEISSETSQFVNINVLEGTLDYISPEQTGRMNRPIDYRTDLYSLGVTMYEIFTGQLPFTGRDDVEIVYNHLASLPLSPSEIIPDFPDMISRIILKLLSKNAEDRYQSSRGLKKDLEFCLTELKSKGSIDEFELAKKDFTEIFQIPHTLYGRKNEIKILLDGFKKAADGYTEIILVSGYSGIGKSSLIHEVHKAILGKKGNFISGKFNHIEKNTPYYAIIKAFRDLLSQLLAEKQEILDVWKKQLLGALGPNAQIMIDIFPELEQIIGSHSPVVELNPMEAQNRFQMIFREFIKVFAAKEHPLVIFLDDIQWSDISTLNLISFLLGSTGLGYFLLICAYRDNEVNAGHPLLSMIEKWNLNNFGGKLEGHRIVLKPLEKAFVNQLIADTLKCHFEETENLSELIFKKTNGNPFFINQVLNTLYKSGTIKFNPKTGKWDWNINEVEKIRISDNVIGLIVKNLELLPPEIIDILKHAACIGNRFDMSLLSLIENYPLSFLGNAIWIAIEKDIISPLNINYRFISIIEMSNVIPREMKFCFKHDRIYQAVYSLISEDEKIKIHKQIGNILLEEYKKSGQHKIVFDVVNHLNMAKVSISDFNERRELSGLNFQAGTQAKKSTAYSVATEYFEIAVMLLTDKEWAKEPGSRFELLVEYANALLLSGNLVKAWSVCDQLENFANSNIDKCIVSNIKVLILEFQGKIIEAIDEMRKALQLLNVTLPLDPQEIGQKLQEGIGKMQQGLAQRPAEELVNLPEMADPEKIMALQLLYQVIPPALQTNPALYLLCGLMMFELSLSYGTHPLSAKCFADCGIIQLSTLGNALVAYKLGHAAFDLIKKYKAETMKPSVYFGFTFLSHWNVHYKESLDYYDLAYRCGLETGDIQHAAYSISHKILELLWVGQNLNECMQETVKAINFLKEVHTAMPLLLAEIIEYTIEKFKSPMNEEQMTIFDKRDNELIANIEKTHNIAFILRFFQCNAFFFIIAERMDIAEKWNNMADNMIMAGLSDFPTADHYLFKGLIILNKWNTMTPEEQQKAEETLNTILGNLKKWSDNCPENFLHKYYLLAAEMGKIRNEPLENIIGLYKKAVSAIGEGDFLQMKAYINELQGKFWLDKGYDEIGNTFIRNAFYQYRQWGAIGKLEILEAKYHHFFTYQEENQKKKSRSHTSDGDSIDMLSILKSTQAISSEIKLEKLLIILIQTIIENAGAQHGCLLLKNDNNDELYIEASIKSDAIESIEILKSLPYTESDCLCPEIIQYVARTLEFVVINNARAEGKFQTNSYIKKNNVKSVLCFPVIYQNKLKGVVYLENNLSANVFTAERVEILKILSSQASISIDNARLYENLEEKVEDRTIQLKKANTQLKELALHDPLTNLHNRRFTYEFVSDHVNSFVRNKVRAIGHKNERDLSYESNVLGIFLMDIDYFKDVNDSFGHKAGDLVLVELSKMIKSLIRADDYVVRWGGEEFLIILNNTKPEFLDVFARRILGTTAQTPVNLDNNHCIYKTCSLGYTELPCDQNMPEILSLEQTINLSDYALYLAKEHGRNRAAHLQVKKQSKIDDNLLEYLRTLSKGSIINEEYIDINFIQQA
ncbi:MAG: AAA family ATPase [Spirochaetales bacterium]|nr:AAA family ATPase [Spirochaetales bacterium]